MSVCHAVKEDPVLAVRSVFDEGDVVAGLDAEHSEQLQFVSGQSVGYPATHVTFGNVQRSSMMGLALRMSMHLEKKPHMQYELQLMTIFIIILRKDLVFYT